MASQQFQLPVEALAVTPEASMNPVTLIPGQTDVTVKGTGFSVVLEHSPQWKRVE